jgi:hypothetical protein
MAKKSVVRPSKPIVTALLMCDGVGRDPSSSKITLYGLFDKFVISSVPSTATFYIVARVICTKTKHKIGLEVLTPNKKSLFKDGGPSVELDTRPGRLAQLVLQIGSLPLTKFGVLTLQLQVDGKNVGHPIEVPVEKKPVSEG